MVLTVMFLHCLKIVSTHFLTFPIFQRAKIRDNVVYALYMNLNIIIMFLNLSHFDECTSYMYIPVGWSL